MSDQSEPTSMEDAVNLFAMVHLNRSLLGSPTKTVRLSAADVDLFQAMLEDGRASLSFDIVGGSTEQDIVLRFASSVPGANGSRSDA